MMDRREFLEKAGMGVLGLSALTAGVSCQSFGRERRRRPNILFIVTDDQRREDFNFLPEGRDKNGRPRNLTPNYDRLSSEGVIFDQAYCPSPLCQPSRFICQTGLYASRATTERFVDLHRLHAHTFIHQDPMISPDTPALGSYLQKLGYKTGFVGKNHTVPAPEGWELVAAQADPNDPAILTQLRKNQELGQEAIRQAGYDYADRIFQTNPGVGVPSALACHNMDWITEGGLNFIDQYHSEPFFLYFATTIPHGPANGWKENPLATPIGWLDKAPAGQPPRETIPERLEAAGLGLDRGDLLWLDDAIGALLNKLEEKGVRDNTIIFFFNDHGIESGKTTVYQGGMHTVSFVHGPAPIQGGRRVESYISSVDFAPTIYSFGGGDPENIQFDGVSFAPLLTGEKDSVRDTVYGEMGHTRAVIKGKWKYIAVRYSDYINTMSLEERKAWLEAANRFKRKANQPDFSGNDPMAPFGHSGFIPGGWDHEKGPMKEHPAYFDPDQFYNLSADPTELNNLAGDPAYADVLKTMKAELQKYLDRLPGGFGEFKKDDLSAGMTAGERRALGDRLCATAFVKPV